jgi:hypothetical protein
MNIISVSLPKWVDEAQTMIELGVETEEFGIIPFAASPTETEAHGRDLFARAMAGEFGVVAAFVPPPAPVLTPEQIIATLTAAVQAHLDATARTRNYDGILSLCSYAASTNPTFAAEGQAGVNWRDAVWASCYTIMAAVQGGTRAVPSKEELIAELPVIGW